MLEPDRLDDRYRAGGRSLPRPSRGARGLAAALAILLQLGFLLLWANQHHLAARRSGGGQRGRLLTLWSIPLSTSAIHPNAKRKDSPPTPAAPATQVEAAQDRPWLPTPIPPPAPPPEAPKTPAVEEAPPMSEREAEEFRRQWAQLQGDVTKKAIDDADHAGLRRDLRDLNQPLVRFGPAEPDNKPDTSRRPPDESNSMFAGELCVSHAGTDGELSLALPCIGDGYRTDYGWRARVHAPDRGDPLPGALDPNGRVMVRNHAFSPEVLAAFEDAQIVLRRIQVTVRLIYLPDLRQSIQLLSRDDRAGAISAQAFPSEHELAVYLHEWADNVRRWTDREGLAPGNRGARPAGFGEGPGR